MAFPDLTMAPVDTFKSSHRDSPSPRSSERKSKQKGKPSSSRSRKLDSSISSDGDSISISSKSPSKVISRRRSSSVKPATVSSLDGKSSQHRLKSKAITTTTTTAPHLQSLRRKSKLTQSDSENARRKSRSTTTTTTSSGKSSPRPERRSSSIQPLLETTGSKERKPRSTSRAPVSRSSKQRGRSRSVRCTNTSIRDAPSVVSKTKRKESTSRSVSWHSPVTRHRRRSEIAEEFVFDPSLCTGLLRNMASASDNATPNAREWLRATLKMHAAV